METSLHNDKENRGSIRKLDGHVIDQIAAGEVIERPAQLVKEIIENSIDAKATSISLSVDSKLSFISVSDNGSGIQSVDIPLVFERHSTSKLKTADDLFKLQSFGFRGEALSAIGSISEVSLETKHQDEEKGVELKWAFGQKTFEAPSSIKEGTEIKISKLFENVPARKKFLKSDRHELTQVKKAFNSFALIHFDRDFKFLVDGKLSLFYPAKSNPAERYAQVYSNKKIYQLDLIADDVFHSGTEIWLEEPSFESKNSSGLWVYVQNRWIQDKTIVAAIRDGLSTYLMHGTYPKGLVLLDFAPKFVDVNVHPMKSEVRFADNSKVYSYLRKMTSRWAEDSPWLEKTVTEKTIIRKNSTIRLYEDKAEENSQSVLLNSNEQTQEPMQFKEYDRIQYKKTDFVKQSVPHTHTPEYKDDLNEPIWANLQVLGQVNLTYILAQSSSALFLIDQHAAHERVGYEKLFRTWRAKGSCETQALLFPLQMDIDEERLESLLEHKTDLSLLGIEFEQSSPTSIALNLIPAFLEEEAVIKAIEVFSNEVYKSGGSVAIEDTYKLLFATMACHSVIRAGHAMAIEEMALLLSEMDAYKSSYCPHGRPVYKKISFAELDKDFGRTV